MGGSLYGKNFRVMTFGESHGKAIGAVIDGCPAGLLLSEEDIQPFLNRRRPGQSDFTTKRNEKDEVEILSGVFEGKTLGTPIAMLIRNEDQHSKDYSNIKDIYRPGHADFGFDKKYGFRDYRGGGRSSARETIGRVLAGAIAEKLLSSVGVNVTAYSKAIGPFEISSFREEDIYKNPLYMPDLETSKKAESYLKEKMSESDSVGGIIECRIKGLRPGIGEPVFDKLDSELSKSIMSIGAVKGFEIGDGFAVSKSLGSEDNDSFFSTDSAYGIQKKTNHSGGTLGGISDGSDIIFRCAIKPTPSISKEQDTVNSKGENVKVVIKGRHDPIIVPRAVVVVECMAAITVLDLMLSDMLSREKYFKEFYLGN